jgi:histidinol-phosphate/aromatic aminotransferase/cobyric acid decarboxylase-like protein
MSDRIFSKYGLCWNINGLAQIFLESMGLNEFQERYKVARQKYLEDREIFYKSLQTLTNLKVYKSHANFFIIDCGKNINEVFSYLLFERKIYTRILNDKLHLEDTFLRIACGTSEDNLKVFQALKEIDNSL